MVINESAFNVAPNSVVISITQGKGTVTLAKGFAVDGTATGTLGSFSPDNCTAIGGSAGLTVGDYTASGGYNVTCAAATAVATVTVATAIATRTQALFDAAQNFVESIGGAIQDFCESDIAVCVPLIVTPLEISPQQFSMTATYSNITAST